MTVLGIETATDICSSAVAIDGMIVSERSIEQPRVHAELLLPQIDETLRAAGLTLREIDGVAVSVGPGSFTGLRIGLSVAKGLVWASRTPLAVVPTLRALARKALSAGEISESELILTVINARKGDVYCRLDRVVEGKLVCVWDERVLRSTDMAAELPACEVVVAGESSQLGQVPGMRVLHGESGRCSAGPVALEGEDALVRGERTDPALLEPLYVLDFEPKMKQRTATP